MQLRIIRCVLNHHHEEGARSLIATRLPQVIYFELDQQGVLAEVDKKEPYELIEDGDDAGKPRPLSVPAGMLRNGDVAPEKTLKLLHACHHVASFELLADPHILSA